MEVKRQGRGMSFQSLTVAPDGVDLTVVGQGAKRLRAFPRWQHVGCVTLMEEREWRLELRMGEIGIEVCEQSTRAKRLVHHGATRNTDEVPRLFRTLKLLPRQKKPAIKIGSVGSRDQHVPDGRTRRVRDFTKHFRPHRHWPPGEDVQILLGE